MKWLSDDFENLHSLYVHQLRLLLSAEEQVVRALPDMVTWAADEQLQQVFRSHLQETETHISRLEQILAAEKAASPGVYGTSPEKCKAIAAMVTEAHDAMVDARDAWVRDAALIAAAQRIEHYEIASYGAVRQFARELGDAAAAELLDRTLQEEGDADHLLSTIAGSINARAKAA